MNLGAIRKSPTRRPSGTSRSPATAWLRGSNNAARDRGERDAGSPALRFASRAWSARSLPASRVGLSCPAPGRGVRVHLEDRAPVETGGGCAPVMRRHCPALPHLPRKAGDPAFSPPPVLADGWRRRQAGNAPAVRSARPADCSAGADRGRGRRLGPKPDAVPRRCHARSPATHRPPGPNPRRRPALVHAGRPPRRRQRKRYRNLFRASSPVACQISRHGGDAPQCPPPPAMAGFGRLMKGTRHAMATNRKVRIRNTSPKDRTSASRRTIMDICFMPARSASEPRLE